MARAKSRSQVALGTRLTGIQSYVAAKHGQVGFAKQLAQELGPFSTNVNSVALGFMATTPPRSKKWNDWPAAFRDNLLNTMAMRRMGAPQHVGRRRLVDHGTDDPRHRRPVGVKPNWNN